MTSVGRVSGAQGAGRTASAKGASSGGFRVPVDSAPAEGLERSSSVHAVDTGLALLGIQMAGDAMERDRRARQQAAVTLGDLRMLLVGTLDGAVSKDVLARLSRLSLPDAADPGLQAIIEEIRLRAKVEVARRDAALARRAQPSSASGDGGRPSSGNSLSTTLPHNADGTKVR